MSAPRIAVLLSIAAVLAWLAKAIVIAIAGGLDESPLEAPLFALGFLALVAAFAAIGFAAVGSRTLWIRVASAVAGVVVGLAIFLAVEGGIGALVPESADWVKEEAGLWVASLLTLGVALLIFRRKQQAEA